MNGGICVERKLSKSHLELQKVPERHKANLHGSQVILNIRYFILVLAGYTFHQYKPTVLNPYMHPARRPASSCSGAAPSRHPVFSCGGHHRGGVREVLRQPGPGGVRFLGKVGGRARLILRCTLLGLPQHLVPSLDVGALRHLVGLQALEHAHAVVPRHLEVLKPTHDSTQPSPQPSKVLAIH